MNLPIDNRFVRITIERSVRDLPPLPATFGKVLAILEDEQAPVSQVEELISVDVALTAKVLRVVNSAYYGVSGQIASLSQAMVVLGMQQVKNLVLSMAAVSSFSNNSKHSQTLQRFWQHSFGTASAAQLILTKRRCDRKQIETAFLGGLLHDVGRLFLLANFTEIYGDIVEYSLEKSVPIEQSEKQFLGLTHSEVGGAMAKEWKLPEALAKLIEGHEGPMSSANSEMELAVHVGDFLTKHLYFDIEPLGQQKLDAFTLSWLGLDEAGWEALAQSVAEQVNETATLLGILAA